MTNTNEKKRFEHQEQREMRMAVFGYIKAERERLLLEEQANELAREKEIMKERPDWEVGQSVFNNPKRWLPPTPGLK